MTHTYTDGYSHPSGSGDDARSDVKQTVRDMAGDMAGNLKEQARSAVDDAKNSSVGQIDSLGHAVHGAADELGRELPQAAGFIHAAADRLEGAAESLRNQSVENLVSNFTNFARRQPAAAFTGSVLVGFALSRFLKSSVSPRQH